MVARLMPVRAGGTAPLVTGFLGARSTAVFLGQKNGPRSVQGELPGSTGQGEAFILRRVFLCPVMA